MTLKSTGARKRQLQPSSSALKAWTPRVYQKRAAKFVISQAAAGLFMRPGLGKTSVMLKVAMALLQAGQVRKIIVVAPLRPCYLVWPAEIEGWADFAKLRYTILHGSDKQKRLQSDAQIFMVNPEGLAWLSKQPLKALGFDMLIVDESTKFKHTNTLRFKLLKSMLNIFKRRYILTGSPRPKGLMDLFGQVYILDGGAALGRYITHYRHTYFDPTGYGGYDWVPKPDAEERIKQALKPLVMYVSEEENLDLPQLVNQRLFVDLDARSRKIYDAMEQEFFTTIKGQAYQAVCAAVAGGKCRQIANGGLYDEMKNVQHIHDLKTDAVVDLIEELSGAPCLVAYEFEHDLQRLQKGLHGYNIAAIKGGMTMKQTAEIALAWNAGELDALLGQPAAMAHGLNMQAMCYNLIWHSLIWNFEDYEQFVRRILRQGNPNKQVFNWHVVARDTIDEPMYATLMERDAGQRMFLKQFQHYAKRQ